VCACARVRVCVWCRSVAICDVCICVLCACVCMRECVRVCVSECVFGGMCVCVCTFLLVTSGSDQHEYIVGFTREITETIRNVDRYDLRKDLRKTSTKDMKTKYHGLCRCRETIT